MPVPLPLCALPPVLHRRCLIHLPKQGDGYLSHACTQAAAASLLVSKTFWSTRSASPPVVRGTQDMEPNLTSPIARSSFQCWNPYASSSTVYRETDVVLLPPTPIQVLHRRRTKSATLIKMNPQVLLHGIRRLLGTPRSPSRNDKSSFTDPKTVPLRI